MNTQDTINALGREPLYVRPVSGNWQVATKAPIAHYATKLDALECAERIDAACPGHYVVIVVTPSPEPDQDAKLWYWACAAMVGTVLLLLGFVGAAWLAAWRTVQ